MALSSKSLSLKGGVGQPASLEPADLFTRIGKLSNVIAEGHVAPAMVVFSGSDMRLTRPRPFTDHLHNAPDGTMEPHVDRSKVYPYFFDRWSEVMTGSKKNLTESEGFFDKINKPFTFLASVATISGISIFGSISGYIKIKEWMSPGQEKVDYVTPPSSGGLPASPKEGPELRSAPPPVGDTCAELARGATEAVGQGLLLKAERLQRMMSDLQCGRGGKP